MVCSSSLFQDLGESVLRLFPVVLLVSASEVAAACEAHRCHCVANTCEALASTVRWVEQQLPDAVHADGELHLCSF